MTVAPDSSRRKFWIVLNMVSPYVPERLFT
jgi:hypothetical protein